MAQYKAEILAGKHRKHKILCKIQILQQDTTRYSIFFCFGKDEVGGSNPPSSSTETRCPAWDRGFYSLKRAKSPARAAGGALRADFDELVSRRGFASSESPPVTELPI